MNYINQINNDIDIIDKTVNDIINISSDPLNPITIDFNEIKKWQQIIGSFKLEVERLQGKVTLNYSLQNIDTSNPFDIILNNLNVPNQTINIEDYYTTQNASYDNLSIVIKSKITEFEASNANTQTLISNINSKIFELNSFIYKVPDDALYETIDRQDLRDLLAQIEEYKLQIAKIDEISRLNNLEQIVKLDRIYEDLIDKINSVDPNNTNKIGNPDNFNADQLKTDIINVKNRINKHQALIKTAQDALGQLPSVKETNSLIQNIYNQIDNLSETYKNRVLNILGSKNEFTNRVLANRANELTTTITRIETDTSYAGSKDKAYIRNITDDITQIVTIIRESTQNQAIILRNREIINTETEKVNQLNNYNTQLGTILSIVNSSGYINNIDYIKELFGSVSLDLSLNEIKQILLDQRRNLTQRLNDNRTKINNEFQNVPKPVLSYQTSAKNLINLMIQQKISFDNFHKNSLDFFTQIFDTKTKLTNIQDYENVPLKNNWYLQFGGSVIDPNDLSNFINTNTMNQNELFVNLYQLGLLVDIAKTNYDTLYKQADEFYTKSRNIIIYLLYENTVIEEFPSIKFFLGYITQDQLEIWNNNINVIKSSNKYEKLVKLHNVFIEKSSYLIYSLLTKNSNIYNVIDVYNSPSDVLLAILTIQHFFNIVFKVII